MHLRRDEIAMLAASELEAHAAGLQPGDTTRLVCTLCQSPERSLSLSRTAGGGIVWICHRASCSFRGGKHLNREPLLLTGKHFGTSTLASVSSARAPRRGYDGSLRELSADEAAILAAVVNFDERDLATARVRYAPEINRYAFPVLSPTGSTEGYVLRSWEYGAKPKALMHPESEDSVMCSFYFTDEPNVSSLVVVVEDIPSAVRVSRYLNAVALLSANAGEDKIRAIKSRFTRAVFALDRDAFAQSVRLSRKNSLEFESSTPWMIHRDFKDMTPVELERECNEIRASR